MSHRPKMTLMGVGGLIGIVLLLISIILPSIQRRRLTRGSDSCSSNMRVIGQALLLYSMDHHGQYPQRLEELLGYNWSPSPDRFTCAVSGKQVIFLAAGAMGSDFTADDIVAHEPLPAHEGEGANVLYGDGHVTWLAAVQLEKELELSTTRATTRQAR